MEHLRQKALNAIIAMLIVSLWSSQSLALTADGTPRPDTLIQAVADCSDDDPVDEVLFQSPPEFSINVSASKPSNVSSGEALKPARYHAARGPPRFS